MVRSGTESRDRPAIPPQGSYKYMGHPQAPDDQTPGDGLGRNIERAPRARGSVLFGMFVRDLCPGETAALKLSRLRPGTAMYRNGRSASATVHRQHLRQEEKHARNQNLHPVLVDRWFGSPALGELHPALAERPRASVWPVLPPFIYHSMDNG